MIRRTPQEIADFFGCYVAQNEKGRWKLYCAKPIFCKGLDNKIDWDSDYDQAPIMGCTVDIPADHDCRHLYEPQNIIPESENINAESDGNCQKDDLCPHQSEVHVHKEYIIVLGADVSTLSGNVTEMMNNGWIPFYDPGYSEKHGYWYQAMVRGV